MSTSTAEKLAVIVALNGGLGNQLFQYAMGRALSLRNQVPLILDLSWFDHIRKQDGSITTVRNYALEPFALAALTQSIGLPQPKSPGIAGRIMRRVLRYLPRRHEGRRVYFEKGYTFDKTAFSLKAPIWIEGYWQSHRYFDDVSEVLRYELGAHQKVSAATSAMLQKIANCDAICLHVRRGDYVTNKHAVATHGLCSLDYYAKGIQLVLDGMDDPRCFVFSDDPEWARNNLKLPIPMTIVDINEADAAHQDLWLMSACKRFVIANSSLSWWGAWLSQREGKMVVAPRQWFADTGRDTKDLIPSEWIRV